MTDVATSLTRSLNNGAAPKGASLCRRHFGAPAWCAVLILGLMLLMSMLLLPWSSGWFDVQNLAQAVRMPPAWQPAVDLAPYRETFMSLSPENPIRRWAPRVATIASWLGHDDLGRSLLFRLAVGLFLSLAAAFGATLTAIVLGTAWGATAGLAGGRIDLIMMRIVDVLYSLPYVLMVILLKVALMRPLTALLAGRTRYADVVILFLAIGLFSWLTLARVVRAQVMSLKNETYIEAARGFGANGWWIFRRHMLPNLVGPVGVCASLIVPQAVMQEAFLSFLGIGIQPPLPSLGRLAADGVASINPFVSTWWLPVFPCATLVIVLLALTLIAEGLSKLLNPKSTQQTLV